MYDCPCAPKGTWNHPRAEETGVCPGLLGMWPCHQQFYVERPMSIQGDQRDPMPALVTPWGEFLLKPRATQHILQPYSCGSILCQGQALCSIPGVSQVNPIGKDHPSKAGQHPQVRITLIAFITHGKLPMRASTCKIAGKTRKTNTSIKSLRWQKLMQASQCKLSIPYLKSLGPKVFQSSDFLNFGVCVYV